MNDPKVNEILARHGLATAKSLGQNFLRSGAVLEDIAAAASKADRILEIGAGIGSLTALLCEQAEQVVTVEIDQKLRPLLAEQVPHTNHRFLWQDILTCDLARISEENFKGKPFTVVGNLPYYITTEILLLLLKQPVWEEAILMVQQEVAERLLASAGSKSYRAMSVLVQSFCEGELLFTVPPHCFHPAPHVHSAVLRLTPRAERPEQTEPFIKFVQASFAARRKMFTASPAMQQLLHCGKEELAALLRSAGLPENARAETFSPQDQQRLYKLAQNMNE
ncbi:MAG: ribosomal RNA small subunit methyltransferase A [Clostridia bacterium]|nr:ribosomal RNA small subunit methyltransferase A [Clostridia bacterium]